MPESYEVVQQRQAAERALGAYRRDRRDEAVRLAYAYGVTKRQIAKLSGISRTTVDRILSSRPADAEPLPEDVPACTRLDEDLPQAVRAPSLAAALRASLERPG